MKFIEVIFLAVLLLVNICHGDSDSNFCLKSNDPKTLLMNKAQMGFSLDLLRKSSENDEPNLISPLSVTSAITALYAGAQGETEREIRTALFAGQSSDVFESYVACVIKNIRKQMESDKNTLQYKNNIYTGGNFLKPEFIEKATRMYMYEFMQMDFAAFKRTSGAIKSLNDWSSLIKSNGVRSSSHAATNNSFYLMNKVILTADWIYEFMRLNMKSPFYYKSNAKVDMPVMMRTAYFPYFENEKVQVVALPLKNSDIQMLIILPRQTQGLDKLENELTGEELYNYISELKVSRKIRVKIPLFAFRARLFLGEGLKKIGMPSLFEQSANFSGISDQISLVLNDIGHVVHIQVNEHGINTKTSQKTDVIMEDGEKFNANQPFLYLLVDKTKTVFWIGRFTLNDKDIAANIPGNMERRSGIV